MKRLPVLLCGAVLAVAGCGGGDDDAGGEGASGGSGETLTVWNNEFQPDRMQATQAILDEFTQKTSHQDQAGRGPRGPAVDADDQRRGGRRAARRGARHAARPVRAVRAGGDLRLRGRAGGRRQARRRHLLQEGARPREQGRPGDGRPVRRLGPAADLPQGPVREGRPRGAEDARRRARGGREAQRRRHGRDHARHQGRRRLHRRDLRARRARPGLPAHRRQRQGHVRLAAVRRGAALVRRHRVQLLGLGRAGRRLHARHLLRRPGGDDVLVAVPARRHGRPARRHQADLRRVQGQPGLPGREQRPRRPARRRGGPAQPVRRRLDDQHLRRRPDRGRPEAGRVHDLRRLRALARALAAGQVPRARGRQLGPEEVPDGVGGPGERRRQQGPAEPVLRRGLDRLAGRRRRELPALGLRPGPGPADRRAAR